MFLTPYFPPSAPPPPPPRGGDFGLPDFSHGTRGLGDFLHNRVHEAETRVTRYSQQPAVHEATFSPTDRLQKPRLGAGAGAASGGSAAGGIVAELTGDGRFSSGHQLNAGAPAFHPRQHQTPQQTFEFEGVANPDDDDWVKNPDIRSYWTAPDAKQGSSVRQVPIPTASSGRYAGIAAELTSDGRLDPEPWQGNNYPSSVPVGKGFPKPGTPGNDWRREWRGEEPSRLKSAEEHWNTRSLNGSSKGKGKGKKGKDAVGPEWYGWSKGAHEDRDRRGEDRRPRQAEVRQRGEKGGMNRQQRQEDRQDKRDGRAGRRQNDRSRNMHEAKKEPEEGPGRRRQRRRERKAGPPDGQAQTEAEEKEALAKQSTTPGHAARDSESPERDCGGPSSVGSRIEGSRTEDSDSKLS